jgi:GNAT superfamily N-acetyltransferase
MHVPLRVRWAESTARGTLACVSLGFVHASEQNHLNLSIIGGGGVVQLAAGKVVTCPIDPLFVYNYAFGVRRAFDADGAEAAFRAAGRDYVHVLASPSSRPGLADDLAGLGFRQIETQAYRRTAGTGTGAPGLRELGVDDFDGFLDIWKSAWGNADKTGGREEAYRRRFRDPRSRPYRTGDGGGILLLFDSGTTTQLCHFAVQASAQGLGLGRRMLELARGLVPSGRPLWLFTQAGGAADRTAAAAGWALDHTATDWLLGLDA